MSHVPSLVFLHGVGTGDPEQKWHESLDPAIRAAGYAGLDEVDIIAPLYAHALRGSDDAQRLPPITVPLPTREVARAHRRDFERRVAALEVRLGRHEQGNGYIVDQTILQAATGLSAFAQAKNYVDNKHVRAQVLSRILERMPTKGRIVIVAHSLGSVIAADIIRRLPPSLEVVGVLTIGSPLASGTFSVEGLRDALKQPPANVGWWLNFWNRLDPVSARRGLSSVFPWLADFRISTPVGLNVHDAAEYLGHHTVAEAIGFALFGSRDTAVELVDGGATDRIDEPERLGLMALRYGHLVARSLTGDLAVRYRGALRNVQSELVAAIVTRAADEHRPAPRSISRLAIDLADSGMEAPEPSPLHHLDKAAAVVPLIVLACENNLRPFEISVPEEKRREALCDLAAEMGVGTQFGRDVFDAVQTATGVINGRRSINWVKIGAIGAGAAAVVLATGGLALAAAPGVAGAAAITSALAAFGPGGMIGGLVTAGSLVTVGGGGIAFGLATSSVSAESLEGVLERQLAAVIVRTKQHLEQDPGIWQSVVEVEMELRRQLERVDEFSDESASTIKVLRRKLVAVERAIEFLSGAGLDPAGGPKALEPTVRD